MQTFYKLFIGKLILGKIPILSSIAWRLREFALPRGIVSTKLAFSNHDIMVNPRSFMGLHLFFNGVWEDEVTSFVLKMSKKRVIIDIGAHIGYYTLLFNEILDENGQIVAFEPGLNGTADLLKSNIKGLKNVIVQEYGLSDTSEKTFMKGDRIVKEGEEYDYTISTITLDDYSKEAELTNIDLVKIDIEGYELKALYGMEHGLEKFHPDLIIEVHPGLLQRLNQSYDELRNYLQKFDYKINVISTPAEDNFTIFCQTS